ncbi:MAG: hypothetical protein HY005_02260 [Candidatus Staskawiczbacteria bacterium]|nr:hypothetical protein [Candidatus Staskawiczbacteria bacterium]
MLKRHKLLFYFLSFTFFTIFSFIFFDFSFAAELNVEYPALSTGANINSQTPITEYLKYVFDFAVFFGFFTVFLSLVFAGVLYLLSPAIPSALEKAKDRISGAISGLIIIVTVYLIITTINPALSIFKTTDLKTLPPQSPVPRQAGVYLYNEANCPVFKNNIPNHSFFSSTSSFDLERSSKQIQSAEIVHDWQYNEHYIGILFENPKFWGKCKYIDPNKNCENNIEPFASSISIYKYNYSPKSGGVTFYRKPFFDHSGGSYQVQGPNTGGIYIKELKKLTFENVPEKEKKCVKWDNKGICTKKETQDLSGENIASIKIDGDYLVLLVYFDKEKPDPDYGPWTSCQVFGVFGDKDKEGPREIKWENLRNLNSGDLPNYVLIFPIENKKN